VSRILGLDVGERRVGVALSDPSGTVAQPLLVFERRGWEADLARIGELVRTHGVRLVVVGYPYTLRKERGVQAQRVERFITRLKRALTVEVVPCDERLTTVAAERALLSSGLRRARRRTLRDAIAASLLLQGYLDREGGREVPSL